MKLVVRASAVILCVVAARYFLDPPPFLRPPQLPWLPQGAEADAGANIAPHLFENHRALFRLHIGCGIAAMALGLFQFIAALRRARPVVHRSLGTADSDHAKRDLYRHGIDLELAPQRDRRGVACAASRRGKRRTLTGSE